MMYSEIKYRVIMKIKNSTERSLFEKRFRGDTTVVKSIKSDYYESWSVILIDNK